MKFSKWICNRFPSLRTIFIVMYQLLCTFGAFRMVIFDINTYLKDEDVTEITYKSYNQDKESVYPEITICLDSPWRDDQLRTYVISSLRFARGRGVHSSTSASGTWTRARWTPSPARRGSPSRPNSTRR